MLAALIPALAIGLLWGLLVWQARLIAAYNRELVHSADIIATTWRTNKLLADVGMPGTDGYEFIAKVRALSPSAGSRTPALALTAFARAEDRAHALGAGYDMHAAKPVDPDELASAVKSLVSGPARR